MVVKLLVLRSSDCMALPYPT